MGQKEYYQVNQTNIQETEQIVQTPEIPEPSLPKDKKESSNKENQNKGNNELRKTLGFGALFLITLNAIFASSITYLPGIGVQLTGPSSILMWLGVFAIGIYIALCLSELISIFPQGNIYSFAKIAHGHFIGFIVGWISWIGGNIVASLSIVWTLEYLFPGGTITAFLIKLAIGIATIIILNTVVFYGMKLTSTILVSFAIITLGLLVLQIAPLFINIQTLLQTGIVAGPFDVSRFTPFFIHQGLSTNIVLMFGTLFLISEAFIGLESITFLSKETKNPAKSLPKALIAAISVAAVVMIIYVIGSIGVLPLEDYINSILPHKDLLGMVWTGFMAKAMIASTGLIIIAPAMIWIVTGPRLLANLAEDKLFLTQMNHIHKRWKTPFKAIRFQTIIISLVTAFTYYLYMKGHNDPYRLIHEVFLIMILFMISIVIMSVPKLRRVLPDVKRKFKAPGGKWLPYFLTILFAASVIIYVNITNKFNLILEAFSLIIAGVPIFLLLILYYNPEATRKAYSSLSRLTMMFENILLPKRIRKKTIKELGNVEGKRIFELGSSVGTLTLDLAKEIGIEGRIYSTDFSESNIKTLEKRIIKRKYKHVKLIHDEYMVSRVHPDIQQCDLAVSVGNLDHIQDLSHILKDMARILPDQGKLVIVEYSDFFGVLPNSGWLSDLEKLKNIFRQSGFAVNITKWKGFMWNYICISAIKTDEDIVMI